MKKFGIRLLTAVAASSMIVTPVMAAPSVDSLEENNAAAQSEVSSLQSQLTELLTKAGELEEDLIAKGEEIIEAKEDLKAAGSYFLVILVFALGAAAGSIAVKLFGQLSILVSPLLLLVSFLIMLRKPE